MVPERPEASLKSRILVSYGDPVLGWTHAALRTRASGSMAEPCRGRLHSWAAPTRGLDRHEDLPGYCSRRWVFRRALVSLP